jgi:hypothetical protein
MLFRSDLLRSAHLGGKPSLMSIGGEVSQKDRPRGIKGRLLGA